MQTTTPPPAGASRRPKKRRRRIKRKITRKPVRKQIKKMPKTKKKPKKKKKTLLQSIGKLTVSKIEKIKLKKRQKSKKKLGKLSKILLRAKIREKILLNRRNDNKLTAQYRQIIRQRKMEAIRQNLQALIPITCDLIEIKKKILEKTRNDINLEVQSTVNLIDTVYNNVNKITVNSKNLDSDITKPLQDSESAKEWIGRLFLLFKSFDFKEIPDMTKFLPEFDDSMENRKKDEAKLEEIRTEEQRLLGQKKSLLMEIEDNEIRMIAKEQILKERILDQKKQISGLRRQIHDVQRKLGYFPSGFTSLLPTPLLTPAGRRASSVRRASRASGVRKDSGAVRNTSAASRRASVSPARAGSKASDWRASISTARAGSNASNRRASVRKDSGAVNVRKLSGASGRASASPTRPVSRGSVSNAQVGSGASIRISNSPIGTPNRAPASPIRASPKASSRPNSLERPKGSVQFNKRSSAQSRESNVSVQSKQSARSKGLVNNERDENGKAADLTKNIANTSVRLPSIEKDKPVDLPTIDAQVPANLPMLENQDSDKLPKVESQPASNDLSKPNNQSRPNSGQLKELRPPSGKPVDPQTPSMAAASEKVEDFRPQSRKSNGSLPLSSKDRPPSQKESTTMPSTFRESQARPNSGKEVQNPSSKPPSGRSSRRNSEVLKDQQHTSKPNNQKLDGIDATNAVETDSNKPENAKDTAISAANLTEKAIPNGTIPKENDKREKIGTYNANPTVDNTIETSI
ncbi:unnamed protein product [Bursaphelenchus okinawaensis]|uniref:Uncharacterized protein n=1 Tax=Bursaphelenchus okinawaensis TaxID=465554 RepID=A0A811KKY3_9BILA|nr:unnamed protein product [Bursaphelenchus okinawaensis]CAG9106770.1 unnamed protein product [Bursaphelenchus okinawaensis]